MVAILVDAEFALTTLDRASTTAAHHHSVPTYGGGTHPDSHNSARLLGLQVLNNEGGDGRRAWLPYIRV